MMRIEDWTRRLTELQARGLSAEVAEAIWNVGDEGTLLQLEQGASDEDLDELSRLWAERQQHVHRWARLARPVETEWVPSTFVCPVCKAAGR